MESAPKPTRELILPNDVSQDLISQKMEEGVTLEKKQKLYFPEHGELDEDFLKTLEEKKAKQEVPPVFLMDPRSREEFIANAEYDLSKINEKIKHLSRTEEQEVSKKDNLVEENFQKTFEKKHPEIHKIVRHNDILEGQKKFYQKILWKIHECVAMHQSSMLDQIRIFSQAGRIFVEDVTLEQKEQQKRLDLEMIHKEQDIILETIATKKKGYLQSEESYKRELVRLDEKNNVLKQREEHIIKGIRGEHGILTKRIAIERTIAFVLQQLTSLGEKIPERFSRESVTLETVLTRAEQLIQVYIAHTELPEKDRELLEQYQRLTKKEDNLQ